MTSTYCVDVRDETRRGLCEFGRWLPVREREEEAVELTLRAYMRSGRDRLFPLPEVDLRDEQVWERFSRRYLSRPVGVVSLSPHAERPYFGLGGRLGVGLLGYEWVIVQDYGISTHVAPGNVVWVQELPDDFRRWEWED